MYKKEFDSSYAAFTSDGAEYLVQNTDIKLVGVDYLSVAISPKDELLKVHQHLLNSKVSITSIWLIKLTYNYR